MESLIIETFIGLTMGDKSFSRPKDEEMASKSSSDLQWPLQEQDYFGSRENMNLPDSNNGSAAGNC